MAESDISSSIVKWANSLPQSCFRKRHIDGYAVEGDPDITGCLQGRHVEVEVKLPGKEPEELQVERLHEWKRAGAIVGVVFSLDDFKWLLFSRGVPGVQALDNLGRFTTSRDRVTKWAEQLQLL